MDPPDPNPSWTRAPWAGVPQPGSRDAMPPPPPRASRRHRDGFGVDDARGGRRASDENPTPIGAESTLMPPPPPPPRSHCDPVGWRECFDECHDVRVRGTNDVFRVYVSRPTTRDEGDSSDSTLPNDDDDDDDATVPVLFCLHGCPYTALSFARFAQEMKRRTSKRARCVVVAMDLRGHGATKTEDERCENDADADGAPGAAGVDFSAERLVADVVAVTTQLYGGTGRKVVLLGHSMGGAIATRAAAAMMTKAREDDAAREDAANPRARVVRVAGLVVVDVVEGTAVESFNRAEVAMAARPRRFACARTAIEWAVRAGGVTKNVHSAAASFPSQLREASDEASGSHLRWRTDVAKTRPHWDGWYAGLSKLFVEVKTPKLLLLAGTDRLDVDLTVAQMQGKFQMVVFPNASHATHEDEPGATSVGVAGFIERYVCRG